MPSLPELVHGRPDVAPGGRVQALGQLIEDHKARAVHQCQHEEQPLALTATERAERRTASLGQPELFDQLVSITSAEQAHRLADAQAVRQGRAL